MYFEEVLPGRTSLTLRERIKQGEGSHAELARQLGVSEQTVRKWRRRDSLLDRSHRPKRLQTTLDGAQEDLVVGLRVALRLPLDDLLRVSRRLICPELSRSALDRTLHRRGVNRLAGLRPPWPESTAANSAGRMLLTLFQVRHGSEGSDVLEVLTAVDSGTRWSRAECFRKLQLRTLAQFVGNLVDVAPWPDVVVLGPASSEDWIVIPNDLRSRPSTPELRHVLRQLRRSATETALPRPGRGPRTTPNVDGGDGDPRRDRQEFLRSRFDLYNSECTLDCLDGQTPAGAVDGMRADPDNAAAVLIQPR